MKTSPETRVSVMLVSTTVTSAFREGLFRAAAAANLTPTDFCLIAAANQLRAFGYQFPGVFQAGDLPDAPQSPERITDAVA